MSDSFIEYKSHFYNFKKKNKTKKKNFLPRIFLTMSISENFLMNIYKIMKPALLTMSCPISHLIPSGPRPFPISFLNHLPGGGGIQL